ncbi:MAG: MarC family protein, partial [Nitrososphaerales archaeon]
MVQGPKTKLLLPPDPLLDQNLLLFLQSLFTLFAIFDPIGNLPILFSLTSDMGEAERKKLVRKSSLVSYG